MTDTLSDIKRRRILDAAVEVFSERGFHLATVSDVARAARVGKGTLYLYFDSKEALLVALLDELVDRLLWILDRVLAEGASLREAVHRLVDEQIGDGPVDARLLRLISQQPVLANLSLQQEKRALVRRIIERVATRIRAAMDRGMLRRADPDLCACLLLNLPGVVSLYESIDAGGSVVERISQAAGSLADILWSGMSKEGIT